MAAHNIAQMDAINNAQARSKVANKTLRRPYARKQITKPLRLKPQDQVLDLSRLAEGTSYRGACRIEFFSSDHGTDEAIAVVYPPYDGENFNVLAEGGGANLFKAIVELSEATCQLDDLGDEALGLCYSPSPRAVATTERFVRSFGLLEWGKRAGCDCVGDQGRFGRVELTFEQTSLVQRIDAVEQEISALPNVPKDELSAAIAELEAPDVHRNVQSGPLSALPLNHLSLVLSTSMFEPESPAKRLAKLLQRQSSLKSELRTATDEAKTGVDMHFHQYVSDRFYWLHHDFQIAHPDLEHVNAVSWILQEALMLRRAAAVWEALRQYRLGARSDIVASLWRKHKDGRLRLFDASEAPLKPSHRILIFLTQAYLETLISEHVGAVRPKATLSFAPPGTALGKVDLRRTNITLRLAPRTPLSAAWLQLFDDVLNDRASARICQECGDVFDPTRSDQVFCSTKCSNRSHQRAYRARVKSESVARGRRASGA